MLINWAFPEIMGGNEAEKEVYPFTIILSTNESSCERTKTSKEMYIVSTESGGSDQKIRCDFFLGATFISFSCMH